MAAAWRIVHSRLGPVIGIILFVYNLTPEADEEKLRSVFSNFVVVNAVVIVNRETGRSKVTWQLNRLRTSLLLRQSPDC